MTKSSVRVLKPEAITSALTESFFPLPLPVWDFALQTPNSGLRTSSFPFHG